MSMMNHKSLVWQCFESSKATPPEPGRYESQRRARFAIVQLFERVLGVPFQGRVLDAGCGDGSLVTVLNELSGVQAQGIDIGDNVNFECDALPFANGDFDIAVLYSVIEHVHDPGNLLSELRRVLSPEGRVVVITPNFDLKNLFLAARGFFDDPTHVHPYSPESLTKLMEVGGFLKEFLGLWTCGKSPRLWMLSARLQFFIGALLPFEGRNGWAPSFLKGRSRTILAVFR